MIGSNGIFKDKVALMSLTTVVQFAQLSSSAQQHQSAVDLQHLLTVREQQRREELDALKLKQKSQVERLLSAKINCKFYNNLIIINL